MHTFLFAATVEKNSNPSLKSFDMSEAFDTVQMNLLIELVSDVISPVDIGLGNVLRANNQ